MYKVVIIFGSRTDESVYDAIIDVLRKKNVHYEMRICSAHRTPEELDIILRRGADVFIAGAGLAAHLPGVIASKTIKPVIGVPVEGNYNGLDSLLSIMQMPPGVPVLSVGVNKAEVAAKLSCLMLKEYDRIHLFGDERQKAVKGALELLGEFNIPYDLNPDFKAGSLNIKFVSLDEKAEDRDELIIYVPVREKGQDNAEASLNLLRNSSNGLWVGLNRGENAALAAIEILNLTGEYTEKLNEFRKKSAEKVKAHDKELRNVARRKS